jgi:hypothetical protein
VGQLARQVEQYGDTLIEVLSSLSEPHPLRSDSVSSQCTLQWHQTFQSLLILHNSCPAADHPIPSPLLARFFFSDHARRNRQQGSNYHPNVIAPFFPWLVFQSVFISLHGSALLYLMCGFYSTILVFDLRLSPPPKFFMPFILCVQILTFYLTFYSVNVRLSVLSTSSRDSDP